jgi:hypothetical protein
MKRGDVVISDVRQVIRSFSVSLMKKVDACLEPALGIS